MDIQFVLNAYACVMYVASYIMKTERSIGELFKRVAAEARTDELKVQLRKVGSAFLTHRELSAQEAVYRLLSIPMKQLSRSVVFVNTNPLCIMYRPPADLSEPNKVGVYVVYSVCPDPRRPLPPPYTVVRTFVHTLLCVCVYIFVHSCPSPCSSPSTLFTLSHRRTHHTCHACSCRGR